MHEYTTFIKDFREYNVNIRKAYRCLASEFLFCFVFFLLDAFLVDVDFSGRYGSYVTNFCISNHNLLVNMDT